MTSFESRSPELTTTRDAVLADNWWVFALRGVVAILLGVAAFAAPDATILALVLLFAAYIVVDGIFGVVLAVRSARNNERWGLLLLSGLSGIAIGITLALWPGITILPFLFMVAAWALLSGLLLGVAFSLWLLVFGGIAVLFYGLLLFASPMMGALALTWSMGVYALIFGGVMILLAFMLRKRREENVEAAMSARGESWRRW